MRSLLRVLLGLLLTGVLVVAGLVGYVAWAFVDARVDTVGRVDLDEPLAIPPLAESALADDGTRVFDLTMQRGETDFGLGAPTPTWGFDGSYLGPTLRAERGERVRVEVENRLPEDSSVHWHGMHLPAVMDGGPHQPIAPGETWSPHWRIDQPAATLWYHPHPHGETADHVYRGLAGLFYVDDPATAGLLPSEYGVDDVPVVVQDKSFDGHRLDHSESLLRNAGIFGDTMVVNGTIGPYLDVTTERVRLRLLNASNARVLDLRFDDGRTFDLVAGDGGLLPSSVRVDHVEMSPGDRAEVVVEVEPGARAVMRSEPLTRMSNRFAGTDDRFDVLELRAAEELAPSPELPDGLGQAPDLEAADASVTRRFRLSGTSINGRDMDMSRIDHVSEVGATERWVVENADGNPHNFHVHDVQFRVASVNGEPPAPSYAGWQDTVLLGPQDRVELLMRFEDHADPDTPYMFHCHLLRHEDRGMMGQFVVVDPGVSAGEVEHHDH